MKNTIVLWSLPLLILYISNANADSTPVVGSKVKINNVKIKHDLSPHAPTPVEVSSKPLTGTFDITSNYMFRGISQTNNLPAVQGGLTYKFPTTGIYFSVWGSNVYFPDFEGRTATVELDTIAGVINKIGELTYDISLDRYNYPKAAGANYTELTTILSYSVLVGQISYSNNEYDAGGSGFYYNLGVNYTIPPKYIWNIEEFNIRGGIGHSSLPHKFELRDYNDYNIQVSKAFGIYLVSLQWTDTDGRSSDFSSLKDSHIVATVTVNF